ncbi:MAG: ABC transporter substrate-binding protein [Candidatus Caldarchaeales archaeon]
MNRINLPVLSILFLSFLLMPITTIIEEYTPPHDEPGPAVDRVIFRKVDQDQAPLLIERGDIDLYLYGLKIVTASQYLKSKVVNIYQAPSTTISILLNPSPAGEGGLNPFSIPEVRFAINYLIDREYLAKSIYGGFALPMYSHVASIDYDYLVVSEVLRKYRLSYDPDYAKTVISRAMEKAGAKLVDGRWMYNDKPITLRFIIRVEDERREVGNMLAEELEKMGFTVMRSYMDFAQAISLVYKTDPKSFEWHLYTEGWGRGAAERYDYATINQMCAPWLGYMPGWLEYGFWQYKNDRIDEIGKKLFKGEYKSIDERNRMYSEMTEMCILEAIRIWVLTVNNPLVSRIDLKGVSMDLVSGLRSMWTLRSTYTDKNELVVGHLWVRPYMGSAWNPIGGLTDIYSVDIWKQLYDPPLTRDPSTGIPIPFRAEFRVVESRPESVIDVPGDAFIWSVETDSWSYVPPGTKAKSKVIFNYAKYFNSRWHHGVEITLADLLYSIYQSFEIVYDPEKSRIEVALSATRKPILETFKGFRIINQTAIEVYVDYSNPFIEYVAEYAEPWGAAMPWELLYSMDILVFDEGFAAYTDTASARLQVKWLDLIEPLQCRRLVNIFERLYEQRKYPSNVFNLHGREVETVENSLKRYRAMIEWFRERGHLVVSNGPFYLEKMGSVTEQYAEIKAFRDEYYPFKPKDFYFGIPKKIELFTPTFLKIARGDEIRLEIDIRGVEESYIKIVLTNPYTQEFIYRDEIKVEEGKTSITIPRDVSGRLEVGVYQIYLTAYSHLTSLISERIIELSITEEVEKTTITYRSEETTPTQTLTGTLEAPTTILIIILILVSLAIVASFMIRRKVKKPSEKSSP